MEEDSRTATFELMQSHELANNSAITNHGSTTSTPRKRKRAKRGRHQDVRGFIPNGATFSSNAIPFTDNERNGDQESIGHLGLSTSRSPPEDGQSDINESPARNHSTELSHDPEGVADVYHDNSESDEALILHTSSDIDKLSEGGFDHPGQVAEEINQGAALFEGSQRIINETAKDERMESDSEPDTESDQGDALMDYSNSGQVGSDEASYPNNNDRTKATVLAELSPQDLSAQLRYFHVTKAASEVDLNILVNCLVCGLPGHMAEICSSLTCNACGGFNLHTTQNCPSTTKCSGCREIGHDKPRCPYKLKNMDQNEVICDLCQRNGHIEANCELLWRTSGLPWKVDVGKAKVRLSCYECGKSGHLGNDCPTRRPGKSMGTSTWGTGRTQLSIKSKNEIKIKGSARQDPIDIDGDDDDGLGGRFVRPKIPEPARKGKIQIKTGASAHSSSHNGWNPINVPHERDKITQPQHSYYRDNDHGNWRAVNDPSRPAWNDHARYNSYRPNDRRSLSPEYQDRGGYGRSARYHPQAPQPTYQSKRPPAGDIYRPMPSAAKTAWSKHRM